MKEERRPTSRCMCLVHWYLACRYQVPSTSTSSPGDAVASGSSLVLSRTATDTHAGSPQYGIVRCIRYRSQRSTRRRAMSVALIRVGPPGYFTHIPITTPIVHRIRHEKLLYLEFFRSPNGFFLSETAVTKPFWK